MKFSIPEIDPTLLPAGKYFVGDPCYAFNHMTWDELMKVVYSIPFLPNFIQIDDEKFMWSEYTAYGDGCYFDQRGNEYGVDSGTIGVVPFEYFEEDLHLLGLGLIKTFDKPFKVECEAGQFVIGDIIINTGDEY